MKIKQGYWNCFVAFQVDSITAITKCIKQGRFDQCVLAIHEGDEYSTNSYLESNHIEEIDDYLTENLEVLKETGDNIFQIHGQLVKEKSMIALAIPILMTSIDEEKLICPVFLYLMNSGMCTVKVRVPITNFDTNEFFLGPITKWYKSVELPLLLKEDVVFIEGNSGNNGIADIQDLLYAIAYAVFGEHLKSGNIIVCFENYTIMESEQFLNIIDRNKENSVDIHTLKLFGVRPGRVITTGSLEAMKKNTVVDDSISDLDFLENSIQSHLDWTICLAMWKKMNELTCLMASAQKTSDISQSIAKYNMMQHEIDSMLDNGSFQIKKAYRFILESLELEIGDYTERIKRMEKIDDYGNKQLSNLKTISFNVLALFVTWVFGLPAIHDTLVLLRRLLSNEIEDLINWVTVDGLTLITWGLLSIVLILILFLSVKAYWTRRIK